MLELHVIRIAHSFFFRNMFFFGVSPFMSFKNVLYIFPLCIPCTFVNEHANKTPKIFFVPSFIDCCCLVAITFPNVGIWENIDL